MAKGGPRPNPTREKFDQVSAQFWSLQQIEHTPEEQEYIQLCDQLGKMLNDFRAELADLERENQKLQDEFESCSATDETKASLEARFQRLVTLKRDLDQAERT